MGRIPQRLICGAGVLFARRSCACQACFSKGRRDGDSFMEAPPKRVAFSSRIVEEKSPIEIYPPSPARQPEPQPKQTEDGEDMQDVLVASKLVATIVGRSEERRRAFSVACLESLHAPCTLASVQDSRMLLRRRGSSPATSTT